MPRIAFTDLTIKSLKEGTYFDTKTSAFGLRVGKNRRTWIVLKGARSAKLAIGHYPNCSLKQARQKALVALGTPHTSSNSPKFTEARNQFLMIHGATLRPRSLYQLQRTLRRHFHWNKTVDRITHYDVSLSDVSACETDLAA